MTPPWLIVVVIAEILARLLIPPKSLSAAAEREAIRRQIVGPSVGFYGNDNLDQAREAVAPDASLSPAVRVDGTVFDSRDEAWWRQRVAVLGAAILGEERRAVALELDIARLDSEAIARDDPAQQAVLRQQAIEAREQLERARSGLVARREELARLLEEARQLDVPPGWLR